MSTDRRLHVDAQIVGTDADVNVNLNAQTADITIADGGNSLTVDSVADATDAAAHGASQTGFRVMGSDGTNDQQVLVDASGHLQVDVLTGGGGGTERADDTDTHANGHAGTAVMGVATPSDGVVDANDYGHLAMSTDRRLLVDSQIVGTDADIDVNISAQAGDLTIADGGNSLTVDTVADATDAAAHGASQTGFRAMGSDGTNDQQLSVTAAGHVNIADGGNTITVDGTVTADAGTGPWPITDNSGSITVDAPVATPVNVQLSDGTDTALVSAAGALLTDASATTQPVSGTVTANAGTGTFTVDGSGVTQPVSGTVTVTDGLNVEGDVAHDAADSGNPNKMGMKALSHGTNPTEVANDDRSDLYCNVAGVPFMIGGHPNVQTFRANYTGAQTDTAIVSTTEKIVVTRVSVTADNANTVDVQARIGFGATTTPTGAGVLLSHPGIAAGSGVVEGSGAGMLGVGAAGEDVRITSEVPTGGSIDVVVSYYEIAT